jgi:hypothetical protein
VAAFAGSLPCVGQGTGAWHLPPDAVGAARRLSVPGAMVIAAAIRPWRPLPHPSRGATRPGSSSPSPSSADGSRKEEEHRAVVTPEMRPRAEEGRPGDAPTSSLRVTHTKPAVGRSCGCALAIPDVATNTSAPIESHATTIYPFGSLARVQDCSSSTLDRARRSPGTDAGFATAVQRTPPQSHPNPGGDRFPHLREFIRRPPPSSTATGTSSHAISGGRVTHRTRGGSLYKRQSPLPAAAPSGAVHIGLSVAAQSRRRGACPQPWRPGMKGCC